VAQATPVDEVQPIVAPQAAAAEDKKETEKKPQESKAKEAKKEEVKASAEPAPHFPKPSEEPNKIVEKAPAQAEIKPAASIRTHPTPPASPKAHRLDGPSSAPRSTPLVKEQPKAAAKPVAKKAEPVAKKPLHEGDLIADVFEAVSDLHFLRDTHEGADFILGLALEKLRSTVGMVQLYDINRREFVVIKAFGPGQDQTIGGRTAERDPLTNEIMKRRRPFVIDAANDARVRGGRWSALGGDVGFVLAASVAQGGRFLGILELGIAGSEQPYRQAEIEAIAYLAEQFAEFVAARGIVFGSSTSTPPPR